ncbi:MAG: phytoene desaturase family protein [Myxococcota bacterium]
MKPVVIVGAGLGGLAAAISLSARDVPVVVVEASGGPGGKAGEATVEGVTFDTGPSVFTLKSVLDGLLAPAGVSAEDVLTLREPDPAFVYRWPDGTVLNMHPELQATEASVREALGSDAAADFAGFMAYSKAIWDAAAPYFVLAPAPSFRGMASLGPGALKAASRIDPFRSMQAAIDAQVRSPHLRDVFARFATYNGSDPRVAPATLNCIAHVEMGLGAFGILGGIHQLPVALARVASDLGVSFRYNAPVEAVEVHAGRVRSVRTRGGERLDASAVVVNADVAHLVEDLLPQKSRTSLKASPPTSTSGWTAVLRARPSVRVAHTALFPSQYPQEFVDLFDRRRPPQDPTVYICDQEVAHGRDGWSDGSPIFVMANAPCEATPSEDQVWQSLSERVRQRLVEAEVVAHDAPIVWERSPRGLAERFPGSRGALYGAASNGMFSAFQRPPNAVRKPAGLYLASGSAHPGGGMPLCIQSGRLAADAVFDGLGVR